jgi:hypothetical protein
MGAESVFPPTPAPRAREAVVRAATARDREPGLPSNRFQNTQGLRTALIGAMMWPHGRCGGGSSRSLRAVRGGTGMLRTLSRVLVGSA